MIALTFFQEWGRSFLMMPIWWYTRGLQWFITKSFAIFTYYQQVLAVDVWIKNLFVPMFGLQDWQSRIISVFMRFVQIIGRSIALLLAFLLFLGSLIIYLFLLPALILGGITLFV